MKPIVTFILILSLASLACLQTAMVADIQTPGAPTQTAILQEIESGEVFEPTAWEATPQTCAIVTASKALNLRTEPSEKAIIITELLNGNMVVVIGRVGEWWRVETPFGTGYAKADYLQETGCE